MNKIALLTSGREVAGMNAAIRAVVRKAIFHQLDVFGIRNGFAGLLQDELTPMGLGSVGDIIHRGGTMLQSTLFSGFVNEEAVRQALNVLRERAIDGLVVIGDNGALRAARQLAECGVSTIAIPASAENDIPQTDYALGFDTAVNTTIEAIDKIRDTASSHERTYVIEVLGGRSDDLPLWAGLCAGAETIVLPGSEDSMELVLQRIRQGYERGKTHSIIVVSESYSRKNEIAKTIERETGFETKVTVLGHLQRGGAPSAYDRMIGSRMGARAVDLLLERRTGHWVTVRNSELTVLPLAITDGGKSNKEASSLIYRLAQILSI